MSASLDEVRHIKETAVHTHWCSFQQTTKWICIIVASISRIDWVRHHLLHRESHQAVIMEDLQSAPWLAEELGHWWTDRWHHTVFRNICLQNIQCAHNRLYRCSTALVVLQDRGNQKQWPQQAMRSVFTWREPIINRWYGEIPTAPHLSSLRPQKWDGDLWIQNCSTYWWHWVRYQTVASRWSHVHVVNSARLVAANARSQDCDPHQCVHASIRRLAWIGIHEDWLRCLKAVHAGVPTPGKSPKLRFGSHFVYAN